MQRPYGCKFLHICCCTCRRGTLPLPQQPHTAAAGLLLTNEFNNQERNLVRFARASWTVCHFPSPLYDLQIRKNTAVYLTSQRDKIAAFRWRRRSWHIFRAVHLLLMISFEKHIASSTFIWCTVQMLLKGTRKHANTSASTSHAHPKPLCYWIEMEPTAHFLGVLI